MPTNICRVSGRWALSVAMLAVLSSPLSAQRSAARESALSAAILDAAVDYAKVPLKNGAPFLVDSGALHATRPAQTPAALVAALGHNARLSTSKQAIYCAAGARRCAVQDRGVFATVMGARIVGDSAWATVDLRWTVEPKPQDEFVVGVQVEFQYARSGEQWILKRTVLLREY